MIRRLLLLFLILLVSFSSLHAATRFLDKVKLINKKPLIRKIIVTGNASFSEKKIKAQLASREDGFWQGVRLMRSNRLKKGNLFKDSVLVSHFYQSQGYLDSHINIDFDRSSDTLGIDLKVIIIEGPQYKIRKTEVKGDLGQDEYRLTRMTDPLDSGKVVNRFVVKQIQEDMKTFYANKGYPYCDIIVDLEKFPADSTVIAHYTIARGMLVVFGDLLVDTSLTTRPDVIQKEIVFKKGEIYSRDKFFESQQRLIRTNLFSYVTLAHPDSMSQLDSLMPSFKVTAVERPPRFVNLALGAAQDKEKGFVMNVTGAFGNRNIRGTARKVTFQTISSFQAFNTWSFVRQDFQFDYTQPYLFGQRMPLVTTFKYEPGVRSQLQKYRIQDITLECTLVKEFSLYTKLSLAGTYEQFTIFDVDPAEVRQYKDEQGINVDRKIALQLEQDTRPLNNKFNPSRGSYTQYYFQYVGGILGGDNSFTKLLYNWSKYNVFTKNGVFASRLRVGWVREFGTSNFVPSKERFYMGGAYTIRGFSENTFGPKNSAGDPDGGESFGLINLELRKPLIALVWPIWGSYFIDTGYNVAKLGQLSIRSIAVTTGIGIQIVSPLGPVRFDYGQRTTINHYPGGGVLHFGILYAF